MKITRLKLKNGGDDNQCMACGEGFLSTEAFDRHRAGRYGKNRHCLDREGMFKAGLVRDDGFWRSWNPPIQDGTFPA